MSSTNKDNFSSSIPVQISFICLTCLLSLKFWVMYWTGVVKWLPLLRTWLYRKCFWFLSFSIMLTVGFSVWGNEHLYLLHHDFYYEQILDFVKGFFYTYWSHIILTLFLFYAVLHWLIYVLEPFSLFLMKTIPGSFPPLV